MCVWIVLLILSINLIRTLICFTLGTCAHTFSISSWLTMIWRDHDELQVIFQLSEGCVGEWEVSQDMRGVWLTRRWVWDSREWYVGECGVWVGDRCVMSSNVGRWKGCNWCVSEWGVYLSCIWVFGRCVGSVKQVIGVWVMCNQKTIKNT